MKTNVQRGRSTAKRLVSAVAAATTMLLVAACAEVPSEAVELSNTVGRDLEEVHRAHRAITARYFDLIEKDINRFVDDVYGPAYVTQFAMDFQLDTKVAGIVAEAPQNLLPLMTRFVEKAVGVIEEKRAELLEPLKKQRASVVTQIDDAHRQIQAAHAIVTGHLASVRSVHEAQNEVFKAVGLDGLREKIAQKTVEVSDRIAGLIEKGEEAGGKMDDIEDVLKKIKESFE